MVHTGKFWTLFKQSELSVSLCDSHVIFYPGEKMESSSGPTWEELYITQLSRFILYYNRRRQQDGISGRIRQWELPFLPNLRVYHASYDLEHPKKMCDLFNLLL